LFRTAQFPLTTASEMTYIVSSGALNSTHSLTPADQQGAQTEPTIANNNYKNEFVISHLEISGMSLIHQS